MKNFLKTTKGKVVAGVSGAATVAVVAVIIVLFVLGDKGYRTVSLEELNGTTIVTTDGTKEKEAYKGMHLYSGDDVKVQKESDLTMLLDMDKYVYAEEGTHFWLECAGKKDSTQTVIKLEDGSVLNRLKNNLNEGEVYQVDTPNSTMAVRGTVFRVTVYRGEDGLSYTLIEVFDGLVQVDLKNEQGEYNGVSETFGPGESALVRGNDEFSEFVVGDNGEIKQEIAYKDIPQGTAKVLVKFIDDGEKLCITKELLMDYTQLMEHKMETKEGKPATCTEEGYEEQYCVVCNEVTQTVTLPMVDHMPGDWVITKEATCLEEGHRHQVCSVCGTICLEEAITALGHTLGSEEIIKEADCTHVGKKNAICEECGEVLENIEIAKLGHKAGDWIITKKATCTKEGRKIKKCTVCNKTVKTAVIKTKGHKIKEWTVESNSTCTKKGQKQKVCTECGKVVEIKSLDPTAHNAGDWEIVTKATCTTEGKKQKVCKDCKQVVEMTVIPVTGHTSGNWKETKAATCTADGERQKTCTGCNAVLEKETITATGHTSGDWKETKAATCTTDGERQKECSICKAITEKEKIIATGHNAGNWTQTKAATCTADGERQKTCTVCGTVTEKETITATGHSGEWLVTAQPTCEEAGQEIRECAVCGESESREIAALGHIFASVEEMESWHDYEYADDTTISAIYCNRFCTREGCPNMDEPYPVRATIVYNNDGSATCSECGQYVNTLMPEIMPQ